MNKVLVPVTHVLSQTFESVKKVIFTPYERTTISGESFQSGVKILQAVQVPHFKHKYEYREVLITLVKSCGYSRKEAADLCGLSYPYATKLLRQK